MTKKYNDLAGKVGELNFVPPLRQALLRAGALEAYLVGGVVRDTAMGLKKKHADLDLALPLFEKELPENVAESLQGTAFTLDLDTGSWRVAAPMGVTVDLIPYRGKDITEDLKGRDYTVNAMAYDLLGGTGILDPLDGLLALEEGLLKLCSDLALFEDPLRVMRAYRFASTLGMRFEPGLPKVLGGSAKLLKKVSPERLRYEIFRLFAGPYSTLALRRMVDDGVWSTLYPFINSWEGFDQGSYHRHDLLEHCLKTVEFIDRVVESEGFAEVGYKLKAHLAEHLEADISRFALLKWVAFFHDIAKPDTLTIEKGGRRRFIGHDILGGEGAAKLLMELKAGRRAGHAASNIIAAHLRLFGLAHQTNPTTRSRLRYVRDLEGETPEAVVLSIADELATGDRDPEEHRALWNTGLEILNIFFNGEERPQPLLKGRDLISELGIVEGPLIGMVLAAVADGETRGEVTDRESALAFAREFCEKLKPS